MAGNWRFIPSRLKARRTELNLTLRDLAEKAGVDYSSIGKYENGLRDPGASVAGALAGALGISPNYFYEKIKTS
jgi:transcriptional regulator with XRE-family HTH domain